MDALSNHSDRSLSFARRLLVVAWAALMLGLFLELVTVAIGAAFGTANDPRPILAGTAQRVSWSVFVCCGLTLGSAAARSVRAAAMGLSGLLSAPAAFVAARAAHRAVSLGLGIPVPPGPSPLVIAMLRAIEFACLGIVAAWLATKVWGGIRAHIAAGLFIATAFGSVVVIYTMRSAAVTPPTANVVSMIANELIYPIGCSVVLYTAGSLGARMAEFAQCNTLGLAAEVR